MTDESYRPPEPFAPPGAFRAEPTAPLPQNPPAPQSGYGTPHYTQYPPAPFPPSPGAYGQYPGQGYPDQRETRPGTVVGAAVLGFIESGVLLFATVWLWIVASIVSAVGQNEDDDFYARNFDGLARLLFFTGVLNVAASALLITGGVLFMQRRRSGAIVYLCGVAATIVTFIVWLIAQDHVFWFGELMFILLPVVGVLIAFAGGSWKWLQNGRPAGATVPQPYHG